MGTAKRWEHSAASSELLGCTRLIFKWGMLLIRKADVVVYIPGA
jgi:hypothetical protein